MTVAKILSQRSHLAPGKLRITEWLFEVPKDYSKISSGSIRLFARSAEKVESPLLPTTSALKPLPWLAYFQGGPGFGCRASFSGPFAQILDKGYKLLLLDQRGTGLSNTLTTELLLQQGPPQAQVDFLKLFRADNIVRDAEAVRKALTKDEEGDGRWSVMGQSFGGFCCVNYLSWCPEGLREVFTTGGLPPLVRGSDAVYGRLVRRVVERSREFYRKFSEDVGRMQTLAKYLRENEVKTFGGGRLSVSRLRALGISLGFHGGFEEVHGLLLRLCNDLELFGCLSKPSINEFDARGAFEDAIIYALLHEPCYLSGEAGNWSAQRVIDQTAAFNESSGEDKEPIMFTAEMITHSMFEDYASLIPLKETAELLAKTSDWPDLYDEKQLARNEVPVYAAQYYDDLYVDFDYGMETASKIGNLKVFVTNTMYHDALRSKSEEVIRELFAMRDDVRD